MRAAVGSTNPAKLEAVHRALARLAPGCAVEGVDVPSGVSRQPFGDEETRRGAMARARAALAKSGADVAFGLEGGVIFEGGQPWLVSWVAVMDRAGLLGEASGLRMPLPHESAAAKLRGGEELGDVIDALFDVHLSKQHGRRDRTADRGICVAHRRVRRSGRDGLRAAVASGSLLRHPRDHVRAYRE